MAPPGTSRKDTIKWTHPSVVALQKEGDPIEVITRRARSLAIDAMDAGWAGPPFDPLTLAHLLKIDVHPRDEVLDARITAAGRRFRIEYNPNRPRARQRYSLAHEIAHTLFADCAAQVRNRAPKQSGQEWQLEMLCNLAAAELLMPYGSLPAFDEEITIDSLLELRNRYDVSTEAILLRAVQTSPLPVGMFSATPRHPSDVSAGYRIDYAVTSPGIRVPNLRGRTLAATSIVGQCNAMGFTSKGIEDWGPGLEKVRVECVGLPPFPGHLSPRVAGVVASTGLSARREHMITFLRGDACKPRGAGKKVLVHLVNDATPNWGGSFAKQLKERFPAAQEDFRLWASTQRGNLALGNVRCVELQDDLAIATIVGQKGYGPSTNPRIRYSALSEGLEKLAAALRALGDVTIHMPRIGAGEARGSWPVIEDLVRSSLCARGHKVTVYDRPGAALPATSAQGALPI